MGTGYLNLWNSASQQKCLSHLYWNDAVEAIDRIGEALWTMGLRGAISGWTLPTTAGVSQINRGYGMIGPAFCRTAVSTTISGLQSGSNYVHLITTGSAGWAGTIAAKARTTSAPIANADGTTSGIILGTVPWNSATGVLATSAVSTLRQNFLNLRGHRQTLTLSITAGASSFASKAYAWSTTVRFPCLSEVLAGASQELRMDTPTMSGAVFGVYNKNSNAGTTLNQTVTILGFLTA